MQWCFVVDVFGCLAWLYWQHLRPRAPYRPRSAHPKQCSHWRLPSGTVGTSAWRWRRGESRWEQDCRWLDELWVYLDEKWTFQVKKKNPNIGRIQKRKMTSTHLCGAWARLSLGSVEGRGNHPMGWSQDSSQGLVELEMETSLLLHACGRTCQQMLESENKTHFKTPLK